jgi:hypothetical protein
LLLLPLLYLLLLPLLYLLLPLLLLSTCLCTITAAAGRRLARIDVGQQKRGRVDVEERVADAAVARDPQ